jgi:hypothetical protein
MLPLAQATQPVIVSPAWSAEGVAALLVAITGLITAIVAAVKAFKAPSQQSVTDALVVGQAAHSISEQNAAAIGRTNDRLVDVAKAVVPSVAGGRRASDPPAAIPPPADPLGTLPVFPQKPLGGGTP